MDEKDSISEISLGRIFDQQWGNFRIDTPSPDNTLQIVGTKDNDFKVYMQSSQVIAKSLFHLVKLSVVLFIPRICCIPKLRLIVK